MGKPFQRTNMEEKFIKQLKQDLSGSDFGSKQDDLQIWYNKEGDCLQFKIIPNVATIGKRIDEYLTLYISIEDEKPIGFQLKDVRALIKDLGVDLMAIQAGYVSGDKNLVSITALILKALVDRLYSYQMKLRGTKMKAYQEILNKPIIKKPNKEQIQAAIERILDEQLEKNRKPISSKKCR